MVVGHHGALVLLLLCCGIERAATIDATERADGLRSCETSPPDALTAYECSYPFRYASNTASFHRDVRVRGGRYHNFRWHREVGNCSRTPEQREPPRVAHCIAGLARTFTEPIVYKSMRHNLIDAMGGRTAVFMILKTFDTAVKVNLNPLN